MLDLGTTAPGLNTAGWILLGPSAAELAWTQRTPTAAPTPEQRARIGRSRLGAAEREPQGGGSELHTASEVTNSGSWIGQVSHQDPAWHTLSLTPGLSQFHLTNVWSRGIFQNMNQTVPLPCLKPHSPWEKSHAPHLGHIPFLMCVSVALASASSHALFHPQGKPCPTCASGQPFSWAGFNTNTWVSTSSPGLSILSPCSVVAYAYLYGACVLGLLSVSQP